MSEKKIAPLDQLAAVIEKLKKNGKAVTVANGAFDLLHVGHVRYLDDAKKQSDVLVVALNDDLSVRSLKGEGRPATPLAERMELIAALECVDYVTWFSGPKVSPVLETLRPRYHAKGTDYNAENLPEKEENEKLGIKLIICGDPKDHSSTAMFDALGRGAQSKKTGDSLIAEIENNKPLADLLVDKRVLFAFPLAILVLLAAKPQPLVFSLGLVFIFIGMALRAWGSGFIYKTKKLASEGPYSYVRNPLYLGSFVAGFGFLISAGMFSGVRILLAATVTAFFLLVYRLKVGREEKHLVKIFGREYEEYFAGTPRFIPKPEKLFTLPDFKSGTYSTHQLLVDHKEWKAWVSVTTLLIFLLWRMAAGPIIG